MTAFKLSFLLFSLAFAGLVSPPYLCNPFEKIVLVKVAGDNNSIIIIPNKAKDCLKSSTRIPRWGTPQRCNNLILGKMPKVKTNSSAKKRFKVTGTGKIIIRRVSSVIF
jgi:hypothetical protein